MLYGELGMTPITGDIQARIVSYWSRFLENERAIFTVIYRIHKNGIFKSLVEIATATAIIYTWTLSVATAAVIVNKSTSER